MLKQLPPRKRPLMLHQRGLVTYYRRVRSGAAFMAMRTGKTLPTIRYLQAQRPVRKSRRILVVAPSSALIGWEDELHAEGVGSIAWLVGSRKKRYSALRSGAEWNLLNYEGWSIIPEIANAMWCQQCRGIGIVPDGICQYCSGVGYITGRRVPRDDRQLWDAIILDESTRIKNPKVHVSRFVLDHLRHVAVRRYCLTGSPVTENPLEIWNQFAWLDGTAFGCKSYWHFRSKCFDNTYVDGYQLKTSCDRFVRATIASRAYVCSKADANMPDNHVHETLSVQFNKDQRKAYRTAETDFILEWQGRRLQKTLWATERWHWMRRMCGGLFGKDFCYEVKAATLDDLLTDQLRNEVVVVWFAYNDEIYSCATHTIAKDVKVMTGATSLEERRWLRFNLGRKYRILFIQQKVAECGVDLSAADTAIAYSRHASLFTNIQSADRIVHPRKQTPLLTIDLVVNDTVDTDLALLLRKKEITSQRMLTFQVQQRLQERVGA